MTTRVPTLPEVIDAFIASDKADTYHALPGIVKAYYGSTQEADVQIAIDDPRFDVETDERSDEPWPLYPRVRIAWPRMGGFTIMAPLSAGDKVQVFFQDLDDSAFRASGQSGPAPRTRRFGSDAAFCVPWDLTDAGAVADNGKLTIGNVSGNVQIQISGSEIHLGSGAVDHVALAEHLATAISNACAAAVAGVVPMDGGLAAFTAFQNSINGAANSYKATLVKAQ